MAHANHPIPNPFSTQDGPARDLWALSGLSLPAKPKQPHALREVNNRFGDATRSLSPEEHSVFVQS